MSRLAARVVLLVAVVAARLPGQAAPPAGRCSLVFASDRALKLIKLASGQHNAFTGGNVVARCPAQNLVLRSDSLESYGDEGRIVFIGHADYSEPRLKLKAEYITYYQREERLLAVQNVVATLPSGSTLRGPQVEFLRAVPRVRPQQSATAIGRPTVSLVERDAQGRAQPPVQVTGASIFLHGDSIVSAVGEVVVVRPELTATGDSLYANSGSGLLRLMRSPKITGTKGRPFTLVGETIDLLSRRRKLERVLARTSAVAHSEDLDLRSDTIDLRISDDLLQRAVAWGRSRARATSLTQSMLADSIDVRMPAQRVRELYAVRRASAEGTPDTTKFRTPDKDRLTGDTIIARFDTTVVKDTSSKPKIRELVALGHATSLQHLPPRDTTLCRPAIVYVRGRVITVGFDTAKVSRVKVVDEDKAGGLLLEPDSTARCAPVPAAIVAGDSVAGRPRAGAIPPASPTPSPAPPPRSTPPAVAVPAPASTPKRP